MFEVFETDTSALVLVSLIDQIGPVALIKLIVRYLQCLLEMVNSELSATVHIEEVEGPPQLLS